MGRMSVPGVIIHHSFASSGRYVGCPSILVLPDGGYLASHSHFGPKAANADSFVYISSDRGSTWRLVAELHGQIWSNVFLHRGAVYIMGTDHCDRYGGRLNGRVVIRRSDDGGLSWTTPGDAASGLLTDDDGWHTAPVPVATHEGRLWRAFEFAPEADRRHWRALVMSAPEDADLLDRASWTFSEQREHPWPVAQWIEGNVVVAPDGSLVDVLRTNDESKTVPPAFVDRAAIVHVESPGSLRHDPDADIVEMPGGGTKFTIRRDTGTGRYLALVNPQSEQGSYRNILSLASSADLRDWRIDAELQRHEDPKNHAWQYVDWVFDGRDIIYASRTAYDDAAGGANRAHDANYLTFHRIEGYRRLVGASG